MSYIAVPVNDEERRVMENYAKVNGVDLGEVIKETFFQMMEYEIDLELCRQYVERKARGEMKYYTHEELVRELGFDEEV